MTEKERRNFFRWTGSDTNWEIMFLQNIGEFKEKKSKYTKLELLKKYKNASEKRKNWGNLDKEKILECVNSLILSLEGK
jgi:hypothetical protein